MSGKLKLPLKGTTNIGKTPYSGLILLILFVILLLGLGVWIADEREAEIATERDRELGKPHVRTLNPGVRRLQ